MGNSHKGTDEGSRREKEDVSVKYIRRLVKPKRKGGGRTNQLKWHDRLPLQRGTDKILYLLRFQILGLALD